MTTFKRAIAVLISLTMVLSIVFGTVTTSSAASYSNGYTGAMAGDGRIYTEGLDISAWQEGNINFADVKNAGYSYIILRCGTTKGKDTCFESFYSQAKAAGLNVGAYYYSYATSVAQAENDANNCLSWIAGKQFEYPIYFDYEDSSQSGLSTSLAAQICYAFLNKVKDAGYLPGLYSMASWIDQSWVTTSGLRNDFEGWVARYMNSGTYEAYGSVYSTQYGMYQYTSSKYVNGKGPYDANICYKDYPSIVKNYGFNGYTANTLKNNPTQIKLKPYVFDAQYYSDRYVDLKNAFGTDEEKLYDHFLNSGIKEGRCASPNFDVAYYMTQNDQGLIDYCNGDYMKAYDHFLEYVEDESEFANGPKKLSKILDIAYYSEKYADMRTLDWTTEFEYLKHFAEYGVNEWRQGSAEFDPISYAYFNADVLAAFSTEEPKKIYKHYMQMGQFETDNPARLLTANYEDFGQEFYATISDASQSKNLELVYDAGKSEYEDKNVVVANAPAKSDSQLWKFEKQADNSYKITNVMYGKVLDGGRSYISALDEKTGDDLTDQRWVFLNNNGNCIIAPLSRNAVVDIDYDSQTGTTYAVNNRFDAGTNQQFTINIVPKSHGLLGDVDNNGVIAIKDATMIQQSIAGIKTFDESQKLRADVDSDSGLSIMDVSIIQKYLAGYELNYPVAKPVLAN